MPKFIKTIGGLYEEVIYRDLVEADSLEEAEAGNYVVIQELEADTSTVDEAKILGIELPSDPKAESEEKA